MKSITDKIPACSCTRLLRNCWRWRRSWIPDWPDREEATWPGWRTRSSSCTGRCLWNERRSQWKGRRPLKWLTWRASPNWSTVTNTRWSCSKFARNWGTVTLRLEGNEMLKFAGLKKFNNNCYPSKCRNRRSCWCSACRDRTSSSWAPGRSTTRTATGTN